MFIFTRSPLRQEFPSEAPCSGTFLSYSGMDIWILGRRQLTLSPRTAMNIDPISWNSFLLPAFPDVLWLQLAKALKCSGVRHSIRGSLRFSCLLSPQTHTLNVDYHILYAGTSSGFSCIRKHPLSKEKQNLKTKESLLLTIMIATEITFVSEHCGSQTCNCGASCTCQPGDCKC
ncbi:hypothetical protein F5878DRAFT_341050 [Lentinula raphanica]|uniref:Metallothionein n=1 Tax=Lentinula raphanica TaxID=153919 RepID=A0AA38PI53_9AGAR|nr:hypothetical protein F5878DRAFT_341050 [Lentinula raphanica]